MGRRDHREDSRRTETSASGDRRPSRSHRGRFPNLYAVPPDVRASPQETALQPGSHGQATGEGLRSYAPTLEYDSDARARVQRIGLGRLSDQRHLRLADGDCRWLWGFSERTRECPVKARIESMGPLPEL